MTMTLDVISILDGIEMAKQFVLTVALTAKEDYILSRLMISIVTPYYNSDDKIDSLISSLENQTNQMFEWIIVDDFSIKESYDLLLSKIEQSCIKEKVVVVRNNKNYGPGQTRNNAIPYCSNEYITFVDSDDYVCNTFVENMLVCADHNYDCVFCDYCRIVSNDKTGVIRALNKCNFSSCVSKDDVLIFSHSMVQGWLFKKKIILDYNISFPSIIRFEDFVFKILFVLNASSFCYVPKQLYYYVLNKSSIVSTHVNEGFDCIENAFVILHEQLTRYDNNLYIKLASKYLIYTFIKEKTRCFKRKYLVEQISLFNFKYPRWYEWKTIRDFRLHQRVLLRFAHFHLFLFIRLFLWVCGA